MTRPTARFLVATACVLAPYAARAQTYAEQCSPLIYEAEQRYNIPPGLLMAIAITESGREDTPNPHAMNIAGYAYHAPNVEVMADVMARNLAAGRRSVDVGCMQINLKYHAHNFRNPYDLLNSRVNVDYGARYLVNLAVSTRSWRDAVMSYHNRKNPSRRAWYGCSVWNNYLKAHRSGSGYLACKTIPGASAAIPSSAPRRQASAAPVTGTPVWDGTASPLAAPEPRMMLASWRPAASPDPRFTEREPDFPLATTPSGTEPAGSIDADNTEPQQPSAPLTSSESGNMREMEPGMGIEASPNTVGAAPASQAAAENSITGGPLAGPRALEGGYIPQTAPSRGAKGTISIVSESESMPDIVQNDPNAGAFSSVKPLDWSARQKKVKDEAASPPDVTQPDEIPLDSGFGRVTRKSD